MESLKSFKLEQKHLVQAGVGVLGLIGLYLGKQYFNGAVCTLNKSLERQVIIITGANTGIGKETARLLAALGAEVVLACRDKAKGLEAEKEIKEATGSKLVEFMQLDLADFASIKDFADQIKRKYRKINVLIHNAGVMHVDRFETKDGFEETFQINYLAPIYLTSLLLEVLAAAKPSRVVYVSSGLHKRAKGIKWDDLQWKNSFEGTQCYGHSKLAAQMFLRTLSRKTEASGVKIVTLHPGVIRTELGRHRTKTLRLRIMKPFFYPLWWYLTKDVNHGSQTTLYCTILDYEQLSNGGYYGDCKLEEMSEVAKNEEESKKLWDVTLKIFEEKSIELKF